MTFDALPPPRPAPGGQCCLGHASAGEADVEQSRDGGVSAAFAAFISAVISVVLTIAGTLVGIRSSASQAALFLILTWLLIVASMATCLVAVWLLADSIRKNVRELSHLRDLEAYVPRLIRFRHRHD